MLPALHSGGVERGAVEIAEALVAVGHRAVVIAKSGRYAERLHEIGAQWFNWPVGEKRLRTLWRWVPRLRQLLSEEQVDVLHLRSRFPAWVGWLAWQSLPASQRPRLVTTVHGFYSVNPYSAVMTRGERVICVSEAIYRYVVQNYRVDPARLTVIPRGIDPCRYRRGYRPSSDWFAQWYAQFPATRGKRWVVLPARLTRWKGQSRLLALWPQIVVRHPDAHLLLVGGYDPRRAEYVARLHQRIAQENIAGSVTLTGDRPDLREIMAASRLVLSLSIDPEAFGRTTLEALALGVPVIGYHHGGVAEQLAALYPEGSIAVGDDVALVARINECLAGELPPVTRPFPERFTLSAMQAVTLQVYAELTAN